MSMWERAMVAELRAVYDAAPDHDAGLLAVAQHVTRLERGQVVCGSVWMSPRVCTYSVDPQGEHICVQPRPHNLHECACGATKGNP